MVAFPVYFALFGGTFIRRLAFDVDLNLYTDLVILIYLGAALLGCLVCSFAISDSRAVVFRDTYDFKPVPNIEIYLVLVVCFCVLMLMPRFLEYPFSFTGFRRFYHESRSFGGIGVYFYLLSMSVPLLVLNAIIKGNFYRAIIYFFFIVFLGKKQIFLTAGLFIFVYLDLFSKKSMVNLILYMLIFSVFMIILHTLFSTADFPLLILVANYFDYYINLTHVLNWLENNDFLFYGRIFFSSFWFLIPRVLYPSKPEQYGATLIHEHIYPSELSIGYTPGIFSTISGPIADLGVWFMILGAFLKGVLVTLLYKYLKHRSDMLLLILYVSIFNLVYILLLLPLLIFNIVFGERRVP